MKKALTIEQEQTKISGIIRGLKKNKEIEAIYLFGSYAKDNAKPFSDIDICIITKRSISKKTKEELLSNSSEKIDLSLFWELPLVIRFRIVKEGKLLYKKDDLKLHRIKVDTFRSYLDFQPLIKNYCSRIIGG